MGKGYNNYMCKKPFHPGSKANIKRAWMAEQKTENEKKKQDELKVQYEKEQNLYNNRALISSESKDKLELNFMYEAPPGAKRERQKEDDEPEYKFEWQRKYNAPREDYAKGNADIKDQPFGIPVRNVRCIKCHKWGHINTDRECPLFSQASTSSMPTTSMDPMELMRQMREDGYGLKENVLGHHLNPTAANQQLIQSEESDPETEFLKSLSTAEKKKLLRKLKKLSKKQEKSSHSKKKKSKKTHKSNCKDWSDSSLQVRKKRKKKVKESNNSSNSDSSTEESTSTEKKHKELTVPSSDHEKVKFSKHTDREVNNKNEMKKSAYLKREIVEDIHSNKLHKQKDKSKEPSINLEMESKTRHKKQRSEKEKGYSIIKSESSENDRDFKKDKAIKQIHKVCNSDSSSEESVKKVTTDRLGQSKHDYKYDPKTTIKDAPDHPDGFSHLCPQAVVKANYVHADEEYKGKLDDRFRCLYRDSRSPSVKQKYNT